MLFTGIVFTLIGIMARTYAGIFEIHDSTMYHCILCIEMETAE